MKRTMSFLLTLLFCFAVLTAVTASAEWRPERPIILLIGNHPGGGSDLFARAIHRVIVEYDLLDGHISVIQNMAGGAFAVAYAHMIEQADPHIISITAGSYFTLPLVVDPPPVLFEDFSRIALMVKDPIMVVVPGDSPFSTLDEILAYARENPGDLMFAGSNPWSFDRLILEELNYLAGVDITYVPFGAGSEILPALLGRHVHMGAMNPTEAAGHFDNGDLRPIALPREDRFAAIPDVPTFTELGYPIVLANPRAWVMAREAATPEILHFYSELMRKVTEIPSFVAYLESEGMTASFMNFEDYEVLHNEMVENFRATINRIRAMEAGN